MNSVLLVEYTLEEFRLSCVFLFRCLMLSVGKLLGHATLQIPLTSPAGCILDEWDRFEPDNLKQEQLIYCCSMVGV